MPFKLTPFLYSAVNQTLWFVLLTSIPGLITGLEAYLYLTSCWILLQQLFPSFSLFLTFVLAFPLYHRNTKKGYPPPQNCCLYILSSYCLFLSLKEGVNFLIPFLYLFYSWTCCSQFSVPYLVCWKTALAKVTKLSNYRVQSFYPITSFSLLICGIWHYCLLPFSNCLAFLFFPPRSYILSLPSLPLFLPCFLSFCPFLKCWSSGQCP